MGSKKNPAWSTTEISVDKSLAEIRKMLQTYGADKWSFPEDRSGDIQIYFELKGVPVNLTLHAKQMHNRLRKMNPRTRKTDSEIMEQAKRIIARQAVNYLKVTFEVMETGLFSPVEALLAHMTDNNGRRIADLILEAHPTFNRLLPEGL